MPGEDVLRIVITAKDNATASINKVGKSLQGLNKIALATAGALAGAFVYKTVKAFANFDEAMQKSIAVMGDVDSEMRAKLVEGAKEVARTTSVSAEEAASAYYYLASAGLSATEALKAMPKVAKLAVAGNMDMAEATERAMDTMKAFSMTVEDLSHISDVLIGTVTRSNTNLEQMGEALKYVAPVAKSAGVSLEETAAAIGILGNAGIKGSQAGTGLRRMLAELLNPSDRAKETLQQLGLTMEDLNPKTNSLADILDKLKRAGASTSDIMSIFGTRAGTVVLALMNQGDAVRELTGELQSLQGETEKVADIQENTFNAQLKKLRNNLDLLAQTVGEQVIPVFLQLTDKLTAMAQDEKTVNFMKELGTGMAKAFSAMADAGMVLIEVFNMIPAPVGKVLGGLIALTAVFAPLLAGLGFVASGISSLAPVVSGLAGALGGLSGILSAVGTALGALAGAISLPIIIIAALIAAIVALVFNIGGARDKLWSFAQFLGGVMVGAIEKVKNVIITLKNAVQVVFSSIVEVIKLYGPILKTAAISIGKKIIDGVKSGLSTIKTAISEKLHQIINAINELPGQVKAAAIGIGRAIVDGVKAGLSNIASTLKEALVNPVKEVINDVKSALGISSPSKVFAEIGKNIVYGYEEGINRAVRNANLTLPPVTVAAIPTGVPARSGRTANININLNGVAIREDKDIDTLVSEIEDRIGRKLIWQ